MFTKYAKAITVAAKDGGDPDYNASLRLAIEKAKAISMPNDNIQRAIKKGTGELGNVNFEEMSFEGYGLGGVAVIVDALTDNTNRTTSSVRSIFDKYGGNLGTPGCVSYMFSSKGVLVVDNEEGNLDEDTVMEDALEAGADDMVTEEGSFVIYTDPSAFADVLSQMKEKGYEFVEADIEKVPSMEATPKPEDLKRLSRMINLLEENEDVQKVHHNCAVELVEE
jgi:YebC/PmpR family DNA-binding regulatory protein